MVASSPAPPKGKAAETATAETKAEAASSPATMKTKEKTGAEQREAKEQRNKLKVPPEMKVTSPGRIAAAGSTELFDEIRHVVYGTSDKSDVYELIAGTSWKALKQLIEKKPAMATQWIGEESKEPSEWRRLPIHEACVKLAPLDVIQCLIEANRKGLEEKDHAGRLPLHHAVSYGQSRDVIELLLMECPESINVVDKWQRTPLMAAEFSNTESRNDAIELLSKGSKYHNNKKLELEWLKKQEEKEEKIREQHRSMVQALKQKLLLAQEDSQTDRLALRDEITAYQTFLADLDRILGIKKQVRSPRGKQQVRLSDYRASLNEHMEKLKRHKAEVDEIQASLKSKLDETSTSYQELKESNEALSRALQEEIDEKRSLSEQLAKKSEEILKSEETLSSEAESKKILLAQLEEARSSEKALSEEVAALTEQLTGAKTRHGEANKTTEGLKTGIDDLRTELEAERSRASELEVSIAEKDEVIATLEDEVSKLSHELEEALNIYGTLEKHITKLQSETGPMTDELRSEKQTNSKLLNEVDEMRKNQKEMENIVSSTLSAEATLKTDLAGVVIKVDQMQSEYDALLEVHKRTKQTLYDMTEEEHTLYKQIKELEEQLSNERKSHQKEKHIWFESKKELDEKIATLRCETVELKAENEGLAEQVEDSNNKVAQLGHAAQEARMQISKTIANLTAQKEEAEAQAQKLSRAHAQERSELVARIAELEASSRSLDRERNHEKVHMNSAFNALEEALSVAANENGKILKQILLSHKRHAGVVPGDDESLKYGQSSPRSRRGPNKSRFSYVEGANNDYGEY